MTEYSQEQEIGIKISELQVSGLFSAWDEHDMDAVMGFMMEGGIVLDGRQVSMSVGRVQPGVLPIYYSGRDQIETFVQALTPGFHSRVRYLDGLSGYHPNVFGVRAVVSISADLLREAGVRWAEARVFAFVRGEPTHHVRELRFECSQETFEKLEATLPPPGQPRSLD